MRGGRIGKEGAMGSLRSFVQDESGQDLIEYALLASFLAIASVAAVRTLGGKVAGFYESLQAQF
jgi:pilus assembly protein Flp/PilA